MPSAEDEDWTWLEAEVAELEAEEAAHDAAVQDCAGCQQAHDVDDLRSELTAELAATWRTALELAPQDTMHALLATLDEADDDIALAGARAALTETLELAAAEEGTDAATMIARRRLPGVLDGFIERVADMAAYLAENCPSHGRDHHLLTARQYALDNTCDADLAVLRLALPAGHTPGTMLELTAALGDVLELASGHPPAPPPSSRPPARRPLPHTLGESRHRHHLFTGELRRRLLGHQASPTLLLPAERKPSR